MWLEKVCQTAPYILVDAKGLINKEDVCNDGNNGKIMVNSKACILYSLSWL